MLLRSSISSSEPRGAAVAFPRPRASLAVAAAVVLAAQALFVYVGGGYRGDPPLEAFPYLSREAYRYNATQRTAGDEVLLLGNSLMRLGIVEDQLAAELGRPDANVVNLGLDGASPWAVLRLVDRLRPPRNSGARVAVVEVDRFSYRKPSDVITDYAAYRLDGDLGDGSGGAAATLRRAYDRLVPRRRDFPTWVEEVRYGWLADTFPGLVPVPPPPPLTIWEADAIARRRAVADMMPEGMARKFDGWRFEERTVIALRAVVAELERRSYRVVLLETPRHSVFVAGTNRPEVADAEAEYRAKIHDPATTGADAVLVFETAADLGADDSVFIDGHHMTRDGARLQTHEVAEYLRMSGILPAPSAPSP
jgi:hypothetical protein